MKLFVWHFYSVSYAKHWLIYATMVRPVFECACPVWHSGLTVEHRNRIEAIQKRGFRIIFDTSDYLEFCTAHSYSTLHERRDLLCRQFFQSVLDKSNCLNYLLPELLVAWTAIRLFYR